MKCQRGDLSFIFNGDAAPSESFVVLDNEQKVYQRIHHEVRICATPQPFTSHQQTEFTARCASQKDPNSKEMQTTVLFS